MSALLLALLPSLTTLATAAGAGAAASQLFTSARSWWLQHPDSAQTWLAGAWIDWLLSARIGARLSVMALSALISVAATGLITIANGQPIGPALDAALAAIVSSQLYHLNEMRGQRVQLATSGKDAAQ